MMKLNLKKPNVIKKKQKTIKHFCYTAFNNNQNHFFTLDSTRRLLIISFAIFQNSCK